MIESIALPVRMDKLAEAAAAIGDWDRDAPAAFVRAVATLEDGSGAIRRALAWLLNQPDQPFAAAAARIGLPVAAGVPAARRLAEGLWTAAFQHWEVPDFDPDAYRVRGRVTRRAAPNGPPTDSST